MKKFGFAFILAVVLLLAGCASSGGSAGAAEEIPPPPPGTERLYLENGAYAIYRFDLPAGATWGDYNKLTAEFMVDDVNIKRTVRATRLMGNYKDEHFTVMGSVRYINLDSNNGPFIIDNTRKEVTAANEWTTFAYDISGAGAHAQFNRANLPDAGDTGPFLLGIGISGEDAGRRRGLTQLVRNITLHHASNPELNVISTGSGYEEAAFASWIDPMVYSTRVYSEPAE